jgi:hypothetical protein
VAARGRTNRDIDATKHILNVFARHARGKYQALYS